MLFSALLLLLGTAAARLRAVLAAVGARHRVAGGGAAAVLRRRHRQLCAAWSAARYRQPVPQTLPPRPRHAAGDTAARVHGGAGDRRDWRVRASVLRLRS